MSVLTLYQVLEIEVRNNDLFNPFGQQFDRANLLSTLDTLIAEKYEGKVTYDQQGIEAVSALSELNKTYESYLSEINQIIMATGLTSFELIERVIALTNYTYLSVLQQQREGPKNEKEGSLEDINNLAAKQFKNINGEGVSATDIADSVNDAANEIIKIALTLNITQQAATPVSGAKLIDQFTKLIRIASVAYAMKSFFEEYQLETAQLIFKSETITFSKTPGNYYLIKAANKLRIRNQLMEFFMYAQNVPKKEISIPVATLSDGNLSFDTGSKTDLTREVDTEFLTFHFHLHLAKLSGFDNYCVNDLFKIFEHLRTYFHYIDPEAIFASAAETQDYKEIPFKINIAHLHEVISKGTGLSLELIQNFLSLLTQPLAQDMDIWAKPFIQVGDELYFLLGAVGGHLTYQFEHLIDHFIAPDEQLKLFKNTIEIELDTAKHGNTFVKVDTSPLSGQLSTPGPLVYQSLKHLVVFQLSMVKYPLEAPETAAAMTALFKEQELLKQNLKIIQENLETLIGHDQIKVVGSIVTNHPIFSGMTLESTPVVDAVLLKNYVDVGKYRRSILVMSPEHITADDISSYPYYQDDESFDKNILSFLYQPAPVYEMLKNMKLENFKVSIGEQSPLIFAQSAELQPLRNSMENLVSELSECLKQLHYFDADYDKDPEGKLMITQRIEFLTPLTFSYFSIDKSNREARITLLSNFKRVGFDGTAFLINNLLKISSRIAKKQIHQPAETERRPIDHKKADLHWKELNLLENITEPVSPSTYKIEHNLSDQDRDNLIRHLFSIASSYGPGVYDENRLVEFYLLTTVTVSLAAGLKQFEKDTYSCFLNLMDTLNYNGHFQKARNISEEALAYSFKYENVPLLGWLMLFKCFTKQKNVQDAAFYGNAYFSAMNASPTVMVYQAYDGFYNAMLFFRNFGFSYLADNFFESLKSMSLESYQLQQTTLSFLNAKLGDPKTLQQHLVLAEDFLNQHILEITEHGQQGALPWTAFIYNLINIEKAGYIVIPACLTIYLAEFEKLIQPETLENMKGQFFPDGEKSVNLLREALTKTYETIALEDYVAEITALELLANNVASMSVDPLELNNLLTTGLVINDQTLTFHQLSSQDQETVPTGSQPETPDFATYADDLLKKLPLQAGQVIVWLLEFKHKVYALYINENRNTQIQFLSDWKIEEMRAWLGNLNNYFFDEQNGYPINEQESDYIGDLKALHFTRMNVPFPFEELLLCYSLDLASYPPNLLQIPVDIHADLEQHEEALKEYLTEDPFDFIGFHKPVTNIISLEYFAAHGEPAIRNKDEITVSCWIPTVDEDMTLYIAEKTLRPVIEEKYNSTIQSSIYPKPALDSTVNVFVAHGAKTLTGFRSVHTRGQNEGHAIIKETGIARVFGTGFIAVIFICDSGAMTKDIYNQKLTSFVNEVLSLGYSAVVAPAWKYNPAICAIWLETFLESLKQGDSISRAVQKANKTSAKEGFNEYYGFYSPRGWAAMHLYGNPNIRFH